MTEIKGIPLGRYSKRDIARGQFDRWRNATKESKIYRSVLFALCNGKCPSCGVDMILSFNQEENLRDHAATLDHTVPLSITLEHSKYGLQIMCRKCNAEKGAKV